MAEMTVSTEGPGPLPRRWWLFRPFDLLARIWPAPRKRQGVLVVRIDGIGDMVLFHGALAHYAQALDVAPGDITLLGCLSWASLAPQLFPLCRFHAIDEHRYDKNPFYRLAVSLWVRRQGFAIATCDSFMRKPLVADSLIYVSGAPRKIVAQPYISPKTRRLFDWYLRRCQQIIDTGPYPTHEIIRHFRFVSALAEKEIAPAAPRLPWKRSPTPHRPAPYAVINFGGNEPGRRWGFDRFLDLAGNLSARGLAVAFIGGAAEMPLKSRLGELSLGRAFIDCIGNTSLPELLDLLQHAVVVVSNDTGPAHLSLGLGVPTVVIVGGGHFTSFVPYPPAVTPAGARFVYRERACFHCFWSCTEPHEPGHAFPCIDGVGQAEVLAAVDAALAPSSLEETTTARLP
jgi:ADP-heptose:LPS heptosyltransferase